MNVQTNVWDDGYPPGGNYWSDYTGVDVKSGPNQDQPSSDGIGDTPYIIDEYNQDNYPLMKPWSPTPVVNATVDINPDTLNLRANGKWITAHIELPEGYDVSHINVYSIVLNNTIPVDIEASVTIGDYDNDTIPDLMVKLNKTRVSMYILGQNITYGNVTLTLTGIVKQSHLHDVTFEGSDIIKVSALIGDVDCDGEISIFDIVSAAASYGSKQGQPCWNPNADWAPVYGLIDIYDLVTIAYHYGKTV
jgi:hypothetical protein